ncbi:MAG: hypothetical protein JNM56_36210 [Planctomycetia bacterium]|nr:hypothetical protein [Planctomycetia bacterium]
MSSLSNDYGASADFASAVNAAVLALKRAVSRAEETLVGQPAGEPPPRERLALVLLDLARQLSVEEATEDVETPLPIPEDVITRLKAKHRAQLGWYLDDLRQTAAALQGKGSVEAHQLHVLDDVCDAADATASASFRRLWRR